MIPKSRPFDEYELGETMQGKTVSLKITEFAKLDAIPNYEAEEGYSYFLMKYSYENQSAGSLTWDQSYPYVCVARLTDEGRGLKIDPSSRDDEEMLFDMNALKAYGLANAISFQGIRDDIEPGEKREDMDIVKIPNSDLARPGLYITAVDFRGAIPLSSTGALQ
jgi:hypothetical protein